MSKLKLVRLISSSEISQFPNSLLFIINNEISGNTELAYKLRGNLVYLTKGGSPISGLAKCSDLKEMLEKYFIKDTKFIASTYNPVLYYLFPGSSYDTQFTPDTNFIPTLKISDLVRDEVDGFKGEFNDQREFEEKFSELDISQSDLRSIKACDNWYSNTSLYNSIVPAIDERVKDVFKYYKDFDIENIGEEVQNKNGDYSADVSEESIVVSLLSDTSYTDTINLEDWAYKSGKGTSDISGKLDISFMYSINGKIYGGMQTIKAFKYSSGNVVPKDTIIELGNVQLEYLNYVLKIYPTNSDIDEVVINDCTLTIGIL